MTAVRPPASRATLKQRLDGREMPRPGADKKKVPGTHGRCHHFAHHVRFETGMHQTHGDGLHHQAFTADAVANDSLGCQKLLAQELELGRVALFENAFQLPAHPAAKTSEVKMRLGAHRGVRCIRNVSELF